MEDTNRSHIYLAALLHDIGKFYQRADSGSTATSDYLDGAKQLEHVVLPSYKGQLTHKHCLWTAQFILDHEKAFKSLKGADPWAEDENSNLLSLAAKHHLSKDQLTPWGAMIKEADCLSSGMDRDSAEAMRDDQDCGGWDAFKQKRMVSVLETVGLTKTEAECDGRSWRHLPIEPLSLIKECFPKARFSTAPNYRRQWETFVEEFKQINATDYRAFAETLLSLLMKYASCIPSSTINFPDVSLYDHMKTTAALAVCLYDVRHEEERLGREIEEPFLLVGADFSGIQSYIYQVVSKYAGKNLKGRSFYLRLLSDSIVRYLLKVTGLYQANVIYNSGGGFYLLAPNTEAVRSELAEAIHYIESRLFKAHNLSLYVAIDHIAFSKEVLMRKGDYNLGSLWGDLFVKRDHKKSAKYSTQIENDYARFFEPQDAYELDAITGETIWAKEHTTHYKQIAGEIKEITHQQIDLGKALREMDVIVISETPIAYWAQKLCVEPIQLGFYYYFLSDKELNDLSKVHRGSVDRATVVRINGTAKGVCDIIQHQLAGNDNIYSLEFYGGNIFNGQTFDRLCRRGDEQPGDEPISTHDKAFERLGVLRMDVDNLGSIFQSGIAPERVTLSRLAALSRSFDYFFSGYLNTIQQQVAPDHSFIIYSGGDDLFIVGSWDKCIMLADQIRRDFEEYTCGNLAFSLSGGIAIIPKKFPVMKGAEMSDVQEKRAKEHECVDRQGAKLTKNAISFMDMPMNWHKEYPLVERLKCEIVALLNADLIPKSFLSKVMQHAENAKVKDHCVTVYKTYWMLTYDLSRMTERYKTPGAKTLIQACIKEVCGNSATLNGNAIESNYHPIELWAFACRWAELEYRN